jgi:hypothetical protein
MVGLPNVCGTYQLQARGAAGDKPYRPRHLKGNRPSIDSDPTQRHITSGELTELVRTLSTSVSICVEESPYSGDPWSCLLSTASAAKNPAPAHDEDYVIPPEGHFPF